MAEEPKRKAKTRSTAGRIAPGAELSNTIFRKCVKDYGAAGDGTTADDSAINSTIAAETEILFTAGTYRITANATWSAGKVYRFVPGAKLTIDRGITLTIRGLVDAAPASLFIGSGAVTGVARVYAEWFGAARDGSTNDATAFTKAIASVEASGSSDAVERSLTMLPGTYAIASTLTFTPSATISWRVRGAGPLITRILAKSSFTGTVAILFGADVVTDYVISDFGIVTTTAGSGATYGLKLGTGSGTLQGTQESKIENVYVAGFAVGYFINNVRLVSWHRCSYWAEDSAGRQAAAPIGFQLASAASGFTGDMDFFNCQVESRTQAPVAGQCVRLSDLRANNSVVSGVRFHACIFYGGDTQVFMEASGTNSAVGDIWLKDGCQFEGPGRGTSTGILIVSTGSTAQILHIFVTGCYFAGNGFNKCFEARGVSSGVIFNFQVTGNFMSNVVVEYIDIRGTGSSCYGMTVNNNMMRDPIASGASAIYIKDCRQSVANGNVLCGSGARGSIVKFDGTTGNYIVGIGNNTGGLASATVLNALGVPNALISPNI